ncbi:MAG: amino acid permease [Desulfobacterales bacterium]|nr:amino acid permease [Desulfobacterales bacterium]
MEIGPKKELSLFDSTCIIVGIIIGVGIYETAPTVAASMGSWEKTLLVWLAGGLLALTGALCYAELATAYPFQGGDYVYLGRAYGSWAGYLFGWSQLVIIRPADIALMAFIFARYMQTFFPFHEAGGFVYAFLAVGVLTLINVVGVKQGKWVQNLLTMAKVFGLSAIIVAGLAAPGPVLLPVQMSSAASPGGLELALILVLFTYGGWNEMAYVAAEVRRPERNIMRALVIGTTIVIGLYLLVNGAFLYALGFGKMSISRAVAVDTVAKVFPHTAAKAMGIFISISALGAVNGLIFTGARISYAMGAEHGSFQLLGRWNRRLGTPVYALLFQGGLSIAIILLAGSFIDTIIYTAPAIWLFFLATGLSVFTLRRKDRRIPRPYKVAGYPFTVIIFCACCSFMLFSSVSYALAQKPSGLLILLGTFLAGVVCYIIQNRGNKTINI